MLTKHLCYLNCFLHLCPGSRSRLIFSWDNISFTRWRLMWREENWKMGMLGLSGLGNACRKGPRGTDTQTQVADSLPLNIECPPPHLYFSQMLNIFTFLWMYRKLLSLVTQQIWKTCWFLKIKCPDIEGITIYIYVGLNFWFGYLGVYRDKFRKIFAFVYVCVWMRVLSVYW